MQEPDTIMMWKASDKLINILSTEYLLGGATSVSLWQLANADYEIFCKNLLPGSLILLFKQDEQGDCYIIGGAYTLRYRTFDMKLAWDLFGVRNGVASWDDFLQDVQNQGGNQDSILASVTGIHSFLFEPADYILIPDEVKEGIKDRQYFKLALSEPLGRYIHTRVIVTRDNYIANDGSDWQGMYYVASHRNSKSYYAEFHARVLSAYEFKCAITGIETRPVLSIAHIQPFYDAKFQCASNGIVLRSDLYQLFKLGYITLVYSDDLSKILVKVSQAIRSAFGEDYIKYDGHELILPKDKAAWPNPKYVKWHNKNCFEHWLYVGGTHS